MKVKEDYLLLSYANYRNKERENYEKSLKQHHWNYKIIGDGQKWVNFVDTKIKSCLEYAKTVKHKYKVLIVTDCFDVLSVGGSKELLDKFRNFRSRVVISTENICSSNCVPIEHADFGENPFVNINAGLYMGYTKDLIRMWEEIITYKSKDDQMCIGEYINKYPDRITLDVESSLFGTIHVFSSKFFKINKENKRCVRFDTGECPVFLHFPSAISRFGFFVDSYGDFLTNEYLSHDFNDQVSTLSNVMMKWLWHIVPVALVILLILVLLCFGFGVFNSY